MKVAVIGTVGLPANYGGFETLAENLVKHLAERYQFVVYCSSKNRTDKPRKYHNADLVYIPLQANGAQSILYDVISIFRALFVSDVLLILGVSGCLCLPLVKMLSKKKIIINIDGLEWRRDKWGALAKTFLKKSEQYAVKYADIIIADNLAIKEYIKAEYNKDSELIAYGGDHTIPDNFKDDMGWPLVYPRNGYAIKLCRIEPENNIDVVLEAFSKTKSLPLVVIGNWSNSAYGQELRRKYEHNTNIKLLDPIFDIKKLYLLRSNAAIYVHGHSAGGTNPSLVEAMYIGLPIISYDVQYNRETTKNKAIYFKSETELVEILDDLSSLNLSALGKCMNDLALKYYKWADITESYKKLFVDRSGK